MKAIVSFARIAQRFSVLPVVLFGQRFFVGPMTQRTLECYQGLLQGCHGEASYYVAGLLRSSIIAMAKLYASSDIFE